MTAIPVSAPNTPTSVSATGPSSTATTGASKLPGVNVLLLGAPGVGKTFSLSTLAGIPGIDDIFILFTEPGMETVVGAFVDGNKPLPANIHWHYLPPAIRPMDEMAKQAESIGRLDLKGLANAVDVKRSVNNRMDKLYTALNDFPDDRTGKKYGCVDTWGTNRVLIIDGLSPLSEIAMEMVVGNAVVRDKPHYMISQNNLMALMRKLTSGCSTHFILLAHPSQYVDEDTGTGRKMMPASIGQAISQSFGRLFSDVILCKREGAKFIWDTASTQADLKTRNLPISPALPPDFKPLFATWAKRAAAFPSL